jgi:hypothetical protein
VNLSSVYLLDFAVWRHAGSVDVYDEILKETAASQETGHRKIARESRHGLKKVAEKDDFYLVKIHWGLRSANNSTKVIFDAILHATDTQ